jgi:poly(3-hydroxybutyrate) depolymerase
MIGAGHSRPGMVGRAPQRILGSKNKDIDASEEIWRFVSRFRREGPGL